MNTRPGSDDDLLVALLEKDAQTVEPLYQAVQDVEMETIRAIPLLIRSREQHEIACGRGERVLRDAEEGYLLWSPSFGSAFEPSGKEDKLQGACRAQRMTMRALRSLW